MAKTLLHPGYFGPIDQFCAWADADEILWENEDNYQKQTYRNRQYIYGANGKLSLNIPVQHTHKNQGRQKYKAVLIENDFDWQHTHWKSFESAYRTSPYFEFYEDELRPLFYRKFKFLMDFNLHCTEAVLRCIELEAPTDKTTVYQKDYPAENGFRDCRNLIVAKRESSIDLRPYAQVFQEKHGFIPNLSILDLLFNVGPQTSTYLEEHGSV